MIWWEVDGGGSIPVPTGGATFSSSSETVASGMTTESRVTKYPALYSLSATLVGSSTHKAEGVISMSHAGAGGNESETRETQASASGSATESKNETASVGMSSSSKSESSESAGVTSEIARTAVNVGGDGGVSVSVSLSQTVSGSSSGTTSSTGRTTGADSGGTYEVTASGTLSTTSTWSGTYSTSSSNATPGAGSMQSQTTVTITCVHHGTTTMTETATMSQWSTTTTSTEGTTMVTAVTTAVTETVLTSTLTDLTVTGTTVTTTAGVIAAGRRRDTMIIADCGYRLLVAHARDGEEVALAKEWFDNYGTSALLAGQTSSTSETATSYTTAASGSTTAQTTVNEAFTVAGVGTVSVNYSAAAMTSTHSEMSLTQNGGVRVAAAAFWPVGVRQADWAFDYPEFGSSGAMTLRATGPCKLALTIQGRHASESVVTTWEVIGAATSETTFAAGLNVAVNACQAYSPGVFVPGQFQPWYVEEVACRDAPLRACG